MQILAPVLVALALIAIMAALPEPARRRFNAIFVAGAGAAYLSGGLGPWELVYTAAATFVAYRGLDSYRWIGVAWLMHTGWDTVHHLWADDILPFVPDSSFGCAITDALFALWFLAGAPGRTTRSEEDQCALAPAAARRAAAQSVRARRFL
jgi:hypothetical protein